MFAFEGEVFIFDAFLNSGDCMKRLLIKVNAVIKGLFILLQPHLLFGFLKTPFLFFSNAFNLSGWAVKQERKNILNDFFTIKRDHSKRYQLYQHVLDYQHLKDSPFDYLEFGVLGGNSFKWWVEANQHPDSKFYGFDTFEGLPENWGLYFKKGDMSSGVPSLDDSRAEFIKGLFQNTFPGFLRSHPLNNGRKKIIHLDADLFSSTLYILTSIAPYLRVGDILFFDEFNVPNHEFYAFKCFTESFYVKTELLGAVNNYYQVAFLITECPG